MGTDPFWPTYLASVNVLCVPATAISQQRFAEIFDAVNIIREVNIAEIGLESGYQNDLIGASKYKAGSILYTYNNSLDQSDLRRFPLEPNSSPQVVLGLWENTASKSSSESEGDDQQSTSFAALQALKNVFGESQNGRICRLLAVDANQDFSNDEILHVASDDQITFRMAIRAVSSSLISSIGELSAGLPDVNFTNPRASPPVEGAGDRTSDHSDLENRSQTPQEAVLPSRISIQKPVPEDYHKGRYTIVVGLLNLYIGSWPDAMRRLGEGATLAREANDFLWQARALEGLLICMGFYAWKGQSFEIPDVCLKAHATSQMLTRSSSFPNYLPSGNIFQPSTTSELSPAQKWVKYAPIVARATLDLYASILSDGSIDVSLTILTESRIRLGNLLLFAQSQGERIDGTAFEAFFLDRNLNSNAQGPNRRLSSDLSLPTMILEALSAPVDEASDSHVLGALGAVISTLAQLGSSRRHAFLFRSLLQTLVPILLRARKLGASEAGIHPASALSVANTGAQNDLQGPLGTFRTLLDGAAAAYEISLCENNAAGSGLDSSRGQMEANLEAWNLSHATGDLSIKLEILQLCVSAADAMPDFKASLDFTSNALRCGLQTLTISMTSANTRPALLAEEQTRLLEGLKRTVSAGGRLGFGDLRANYWDDFLVRDVQIYQPPDAARLTSHKPSELSLLDERRREATRDPFIFNPFAKAYAGETAPVIVAGELVMFSVILQNPLEIEVEVEDIFC